MTSFAPQQLPKVPPFGTCDGGGIVARPKPPKYACDGGGIVAKPPIPKGAMTFTGDARDVIGTSKSTETGKIGTKGILTTAVLLIGGALLGYGHREQISKGLNSMSETVSKFFATGKPAEYLESAKGLLTKAKDLIFAKKA